MGRIVSKKTNSKAKTIKVEGAVKRAANRSAENVNRSAAVAKRKASIRKKGLKRRTAKEVERTVNEFRSIVNIPSDQFERWLSTSESNKLHLADGPSLRSKSVADGRTVLLLLKKRRDKYTDADVDAMEKVIQVVKQRLEKRPNGDIVASNWRYSLMNFGHDPTKRAKRISK